MLKIIWPFIVLGLLTGCTTMVQENNSPTINTEKLSVAYFAGGCFWCMEAAFEEVNGVSEAISGYTGGTLENPTYQDVTTGNSGHLEAVQVWYDASIVTYAELVEIFWRQIDPTDAGGQFVDRGSQYASAIFYDTAKQKKIAEESKQKLEESKIFDKPIVTGIIPFKVFYPAEEYHQNYYKKSILNYYAYEKGSGRKKFTESTWKDIPLETKKDSDNSDAEEYDLSGLSELQYQVTQNEKTERAFDNEYWNNKEPGIYVDIVSGQALFASVHKFESGTGWPSFTQPLEDSVVVEHKDSSLGMTRIELKSSEAESHLGHVFDDGPNGGDRYCINSASLRFVHMDDLESEGYGEYLSLFENNS